MGTRHVGFGPESTWNTPVAPTHFVEALSEDLQMEKNELLIKTIRSKSIRDRKVANKIVTGGITVAGNYQEIGEMFYYMFGDVDTTGTGPYTHTIPGSTGIADRPDFTTEIQRDSTALTWRYAGCMLQSINIVQSNSDVCQITYGIIGASQADGAAGTASYRPLDPMLPSHWSASFDGGSTTFSISDLNFTIDFPLSQIFALGSTALAEQPEDADTMNVTFSMTALFDDIGEYAKYETDDTVTDVQLIATDATHSLTINMNKCLITQATPHVEGRNRLTATYVGGSYFDTTATDACQAVIVNDHDDLTD